jgi:Ca2+-binding EF-hand superfamily protein
MSAAISATSTATTTDALFDKLDTKKKGYIDAADLQTAAGATAADDAKAAEAFKQIDTDGDGKITKSELSDAIDKVSEQLNAQLDSSRTASSAAATGAKPAGHGGGGHGAPPVAATSSTSDADTAKYVAAADTDNDGTVTATEEAAYKKLEAAAADAKALAQVQEYKDNSGTPAAATSSTVDVSV